MRRTPHAQSALAVGSLLLLIVTMAGCGEPPLTRHIAGDPRAGLYIFKMEGCYTCHAISGVSVGDSGPALDGEGTRHDETWLRHMLPSHIRSDGLPALSPRDLRDLAAYLASLQG